MVAKLRGLGTLEGEESYIREYFSDILSLDRPADLEDANNLLTYCAGAYFINLVKLKPEELDGWHHELVQRVDELLSNAKKPGYKCLLLEIRGSLSLHCYSITKGSPIRLDIETAIEWWMKLADNVKDAPLFPLRRFADRLTDIIFLIGHSPRYDQLSQEIDYILSEIYGNFVAAEKCRDRAIRFYGSKNITKAINQVHQSKVKWFSEETLQGSILSILLISKWYKELNLTFAAKYYALAAAFISINSSDPQIVSYVPRALIQSAACDHIHGAWQSYLLFTKIGLKSHCMFSSNVGDSENDELFDEILFNTTTLISVTKQVSPQLFEPIMKFVTKWNINNYLEENILLAEKYWSKKSISEVWDALEEKLLGRPFGDIGNVREVTWSELGIVWRIKWDYNYSNTPICEQLIAILQILFADLSEIDLYLMKTEVNIFIHFDDIPSSTIEPNISNSVRYWKITLPRNSNSEETIYEKLECHIVYLASKILFEVSLLPEAVFNEQIRSSFKNGLSAKVFVGQSYEFLYRYFIYEDYFNEVLLSEFQPPQSSRQFRIRENEKLPWHHGSIPGYSKKIAKELLMNRYTNVIPPIKFTLRRLSKNPQLRLTLDKLRSDGWLDWHILASICAMTVTYRINSQIKPYMEPVEIKKLFKIYLSKPEEEFNTEIPISEFTYEKFQMFLKSNMLSTLQLFGLEFHQITPDFDGIEHFLRYRCNYWDDDMEHNDPFVSYSDDK